MKNKKLLMPLAGIAALGAITPIIMTTTSCKKGETPDPSITKITATLAEGKDIYVGVVLTKNDLVVTAVKTDGTTYAVKSTDWACSEIGDKGYYFSKEETKTFNISYKGHKTTFIANAAIPGYMFFEQLVPHSLVANANIKTAIAIKVMGANKQLTKINEIDKKSLIITSSDESKVKYDKETHTLIAVAPGTATITAHHTEIPKEQTKYDAILDVTVTGDATQLSKAEKVGDTGAAITIAGGDENNVCSVPEYAQIDNKLLPITTLKSDLKPESKIEAIILPKTIATIDESVDFSKQTTPLQYIAFMGTVEEFDAISSGWRNYWAGFCVTGAWCYGTGTPKYTNFTNHYDAKFQANPSAIPVLTDKHYFEKETGNLLPNNEYVFGFDMYQSFDAKAVDDYKYNQILIHQGGLAIGQLRSIHIYADGIELKDAGDLTPTPGQYKITWPGLFGRDTVIKIVPSENLTAISRVVIRFVIPLEVGWLKVNLQKTN